MSKAKVLKIKNGEQDMYVTHVTDTYIIASLNEDLKNKIKFDLEELSLSSKDSASILKKQNQK